MQLCLHWLPSHELGDLVVAVGRRGYPARQLATRAAGLPGTEARFLGLLAMALAAFYSGDHDESLTWLSRLDDLPGLPPGQRTDPCC